MRVYLRPLPVRNCKHCSTYNFKGTNVRGCTELSVKQPQRKVGMGRVVTSGNLHARDVGSNHTLGAIFHIFIRHIHDTGVVTSTSYMLYSSCVCICKATAYMYIIVSIKILQFQGAEFTNLH